MSYLFDAAIYVVAASGGEPRDVAHGELLRGLSWLPDGSGIIYSSSSGSTVLYPPTFNLRMAQRTGGGERQLLPFSEGSYVEPDIVAPGRLAASRIRIQSDVWRFPVSGTPEQNTKRAERVTHQTGQAQTPSLSPDGKEFVYLSDSGGHGNLWISSIDGSKIRQLTSERDPVTVIGVPIWSPAGDWIVFIRTRNGRTGEWVVNPDGSNLHELVPDGSGAAWSPNGQWLYYNRGRCIEKVPVDGGAAVQVRCEDVASGIISGLSPDGATLYYNNDSADGSNEFGSARPENGPFQVLGRIPRSRAPLDPWMWQQVLSPDGRWLAAPLEDKGTTNLWVMQSDGAPMRPLTDLGQRSVLIVRRVSWSPDGKYIYAAVAEIDADVVLFDGLLP
jgi:Tol biopolymer transport system component